jgi:hypothetical protein
MATWREKRGRPGWRERPAWQAGGEKVAACFALRLRGGFPTGGAPIGVPVYVPHAPRGRVEMLRSVVPWSVRSDRRLPCSAGTRTPYRCAPSLHGACLLWIPLLRTTLPRITRSAPFPPVSSRGARSCRVPVSLPISTTEETHGTQDIGLGLWPLSDLRSI